jgi:exopolysaccharide biosynthesis predicted pyruvyltransferase EpsI
MSSVNLPDFLNQFHGRSAFYYPNPGNAGDALINAAEEQLLNDAGISWTLKNCLNQAHQTVPKVTTSPLSESVKQLVFYGGGGNLISKYRACADFLSRNAFRSDLEIVVLPHTVEGNIPLLQKLGPNVTILCRDQTSFQHVRKHHGDQHTILTHDSALYLDFKRLGVLRTDQVQAQEGGGHLSALRSDGESRRTLEIPADNVDVSARFKYGFGQHNQVARQFLQFYQRYSHVTTDRLHGAIACGLLGISCDFYPNSYYKNQAVYHNSFGAFDLDQVVRFHQE